MIINRRFTKTSGIIGILLIATAPISGCFPRYKINTSTFDGSAIDKYIQTHSSNNPEAMEYGLNESFKIKNIDAFALDNNFHCTAVKCSKIIKAEIGGSLHVWHQKWTIVIDKMKRPYIIKVSE